MRRLQIRLALALAMLGGCGAAPPREPPPARPSDKAALYGDAALLPTREGERARAEVALAEEIRLSLQALHPVEHARVSVRSAADGTPEAAAVVLRLTTPGAEDELRASARRIARATLGTDADVVVETSAPASQTRPPDEAPSPAPLLLLLAVLGLGISVGLTLDRSRRALRRRRRARR